MVGAPSHRHLGHRGPPAALWDSPEPPPAAQSGCRPQRVPGRKCPAWPNGHRLTYLLPRDQGPWQVPRALGLTQRPGGHGAFPPSALPAYSPLSPRVSATRIVTGSLQRAPFSPSTHLCLFFFMLPWGSHTSWFSGETLWHLEVTWGQKVLYCIVFY